jgi:hypothetical protein
MDRTASSLLFRLLSTAGSSWLQKGIVTSMIGTQNCSASCGDTFLAKETLKESGIGFPMKVSIHLAIAEVRIKWAPRLCKKSNC